MSEYLVLFLDLSSFKNGSVQTMAYYYPNGQLESHAIQARLYGGVFTLEYTNYDSTGCKLSEIKSEYKHPKDGTNYNKKGELQKLKNTPNAIILN